MPGFRVKETGSRSERRAVASGGRHRIQPGAIHRSTVISWRDSRNSELILATHDIALGTAARAMGLRVVGV